ncbi:MAG TPA: hypothetical protein VMP08_11325 [Anaerolineae bacterium]|nr:hypothetical protein [Anaerolineae bacterium]
MSDSDQPTPQETSDAIAHSIFGVEADRAARSRAAREMILSALAAAILIPALFYLRFRDVGPLGWGTTIFFVVYCLLAAIGLYFGPHAEYHARVPLRGDWLDRIGAFWLVACVFGPLFSWIILQVVPITLDSWRMVYSLCVILAVGLPLITALPLTRYARGKAALIALPLLIGITLLPIWSVVDVGRDLIAGPIVRQTSAGHAESYLSYTERSLGDIH